MVGNEAREVVRGKIMKGPWRWGYSMLGQITLEAVHMVDQIGGSSSLES